MTSGHRLLPLRPNGKSGCFGWNSFKGRTSLVGWMPQLPDVRAGSEKPENRALNLGQQPDSQRQASVLFFVVRVNASAGIPGPSQRKAHR